jgi:glycerol kinase
MDQGQRTGAILKTYEFSGTRLTWHIENWSAIGADDKDNSACSWHRRSWLCMQ